MLANIKRLGDWFTSEEHERIYGMLRRVTPWDETLGARARLYYTTNPKTVWAAWNWITENCTVETSVGSALAADEFWGWYSINGPARLAEFMVLRAADIWHCRCCDR